MGGIIAVAFCIIFIVFYIFVCAIALYNEVYEFFEKRGEKNDGKRKKE